MLGTNNEEKSLKRWLKRKISINKGVLIAFLISGLFFPVSSFSDGSTGRLNNPGSGHPSAVAIGGLDDGKAQANGSNSVALGSKAKAEGTDTVAIGQGAHANDSESAVAIGGKANASNSSALAIGSQSNASGFGSTSFGVISKASNTFSMALGYQSYASGENSVSVGPASNTTGKSSIAIGMLSSSTAESALALGDGAGSTAKSAISIGKGTQSNKENAIAIGRGASSTAESALALGDGAKADVEKSVAIGSGSVAHRAEKDKKPKVEATINNMNFDNFAANDVEYAFSVGNDNLKRQIQNVGAGRLTETSTDAINGSQLYAVAKRLDDNSKTYFHVNTGDGNQESGEESTNFGRISSKGGATGTKSITAGVGAKAEGVNAIAIGESSRASKSNDSAFGVNAQATGSYSTAVGDDAQATNISANAFGRGSRASGYYSTAIGNGATSSGSASIAIGGGTGEWNARAEGAGSIAIGEKSRTSAERTLSLGKETKASANNAVALGAGAQATGTNSLALGGADKQGNGAQALGTDSTSVGVYSVAMSDGSLALGRNAQAGGKLSPNSPIPTKDTVNKNATAIGNGAIAEKLDSIAIGTGTYVSADKGIAIGLSAKTSVVDGVALGSASEATKAAGIKGYDVTNNSTSRVNKYSGLTGNALTSTLAGVSVGSDTKTRQIHHVAAGTENDDAVNVAQLRNVNLKIAGNKSLTNNKDDVLLDNQTLSVLGDGAYLTSEANGQKITMKLTEETKKKIDNAADKDLSNITDRGKTVIKNESAWKLGVNEETDTATIKGGNTVKIKNGDNIEVSRSGNDITIKTKNEVSFNKVTSKTIEVPTSGSDKVVINNQGINAGNKQISNVLSGGDVDTNAANISDVKKIVAANVSTEQVTKASAKQGDENIAQVTPKAGNNQGDKNATYEVGVSKNKVKDLALEAVKVTNGDAITVTPTADADNHGKSYKISVNTDGKTIKVEGNKLTANTTVLTVDSTTGKVSNPTTGEALVTAATIQNAINSVGWFTNAGGNTNGVTYTKNLVKAGSQVNFNAGDNVTIKKEVTDGNVTYTITAKDASTEAVAKKSGDDNIADVAVSNGKNAGDPGAKYEISVSKSKVTEIAKDAAKEVVKVTGDSPINVALDDTDKAKGINNYKVSFDGTKAAENIPLTYMANGKDSKTVMLNKGLNFTNGEVTEAKVGDNGVVTFDLNSTTKAKINNAADKDLSNITNTAIEKIKTEAAWKLGINEETDTATIKGGNTVKIKNGDNIEVSRSGNDITIKTKNEVSFNKVTSKTIEVPTSGSDKVVINNQGINAGNKQISNVLSGGDVDTNAANISDVKKIVKANVSTEKVTKAADGQDDSNIAEITVADGKNSGDRNANYQVGVSKNKVKDLALEAVKVTNGDAITVTPTADADNHGKSYKISVNTDGNTIKVEGNKLTANTTVLTVDSTTGKVSNPITGSALVTAATIQNAINSVGWFTNAGGNTNGVTYTKNLVKAGSQVNFNAGDNVTIKKEVTNGDVTYTITAKKHTTISVNGGDKDKADGATEANKGNLVLTETTNGNGGKHFDIKLNDKVVIGSNNNTKVTVDGTTGTVTGLTNKSWDPENITSGRAATEDQLKVLSSTVSSGKLIFAGNNYDANTANTAIKAGFNDKVEIVGESKETDDAKFTGENIKTFVENGKVVVKTNKDFKVNSLNISGKEENGETPNATLNVAKGPDGVEGKNPNNGKTRITYDVTNEDGSKTKEDIATLNDGMKYSGDDGLDESNKETDKVIKKKLNEKLTLRGRDLTATGELSNNNIGVTNINGELWFKLAKELKNLTSAEFKNGNNTTVINGDGITIKPSTGDTSKSVSLTKDGLNNGGNKITDVANGTVDANSKDAVNGSQLHEVSETAKKHTTISVNGGDKDKADGATEANKGNLVLTETTNGNGGKHFDIKLNDKVVIGSNNNTKVTVDGTTGTVTGLTNKSWDPENITSGRAATEDQLKVLSSTVSSGKLIFAGNNYDANTANTAIKAGFNDKVEIVGESKETDDAKFTGENIKTFVENGKVVVKTNKDFKVNSLNISGKEENGETPNATLNVAKGPDGVEGKNPNNGKTRITYDVTNEDGSKTKEDIATLNDGMKYSGDDGLDESNKETDKVIKKKLNEKLTLRGRDLTATGELSNNNIGVTNINGELWFKLAKELKNLTSAEFKNGNNTTVINGDGITIKPSTGDTSKSVSLTKDGLNNGGNKITDVANGTVDANSKDAVNGSQLHEVSETAKKHTTISVNGGDKDKADGATEANKGNLVLTETTNGNGGKHFDIKLNDKVVIGSNNNTKVTVDGTTGTVTGLTNKSWDPENITSGRAATEDQLKVLSSTVSSGKLIFAGNNYDANTANTAIKAGFNDKVEIVGESKETDDAKFTGENIKTFVENGKVVVKTNKDFKVNSLNISGKEENGETPNATLNVAKGPDGVEGKNPNNGKTRITYDVTNEDGSKTKEDIATLNDGMKYSGDDGLDESNKETDKVIKKKLNEKLTLRGRDLTATGELSNNNIGVTNINGELWFKLAKELKNLTSAEFKNGNNTTVINGDGITIKPSTGDTSKSVSLTKDGLNNGGNKITDVANGTVDANSKDAVNGSQLHEVSETAKKHTTISVNGGDKDKADGATEANKGNLVLTETTNGNGGKHFDIKLNDKVVIGSNNNTKVTVDGTTGTVTGLTNKSWDPENITSGRAATEDQLKVLSSTVSSGKLIFAGNNYDANTANTAIKAGFNDKVEIVGESKETDDAKFTGENIKTFVENGKVVVKTNKDFKVNSLNISGKEENGETPNATLNVAKGPDGVEGKNPNNGKTRITYDVTNEDGSKTKEDIATLNDGMKYSGDDGLDASNKETNKVIKKKLNEKLTLRGRDLTATGELSNNNIGVTNINGELWFKLAKELKNLTSAEFKNGNNTTVINGDGITIKPSTGDTSKSVSLTKDGLNNGGNKITDVANGTVDANSKDAVNGSQLHEVSETAKKHTTISVNGGDKDKADGATEANKGNLVLTETTNGNGGKHFDIKLNDKVVIGSNDNTKVTVDGTEGTVTGLTNKEWEVGKTKAVSGRAATEDQLKAVEEGLNKNISEAKTEAAKHTTVKAVDENISISESTNTEGGKHYDVKLNNNISLGEKGKSGSIVITDGEDTKAAISVTKGTSDVNGKEKGRIVYADNKGNIEEVATLNDGMKYSGDNKTDKVVNKKLNETLEIIGGADKDKLSENNIGVNATDDGKLKVQLSKELKDLTSAEFKNGNNTTVINGKGITIKPSTGDTTKSVSLTNDGLDNGGNQITNVASGGDTDTNAANIGDIKRLVNVGKTEVKGDENFNITDKVNDKGHTEYNVKLADKVVIGSKDGSKVTVDGTKGTVNGLTNRTWDPEKVVNGQAATEDQLKAIDNKLNTGLNFAGNDESNKINKKVGDTLQIVGESKEKDSTKFSGENLKTFVEDGKIKIKMNKDLVADSLTLDKVKISKGGLDNGGNKITNVGRGTNDTDAVNVSQLKELEQTIIGGNSLALDGVATGVAMANLPQVSNITGHRFNIATSYGTYAGHHSFALGLSGLNDRGTIVYKASGALTSKGHVSFGVGLSYQFDKNDRVNDTERNKISELENMVKELQEKEAKHISKEAETQELINKLLQRIENLENKK